MKKTTSFRTDKLQPFSYWFVRCSNLIKASALSMLMLFSFSSCTKEYSGSVVFWYTESTAQLLNSSGVYSISVYVDNKFIGTYSTSKYYSSIPTCATNGAVTVTKDLGSSERKSYTYFVRDDYGNKWWDGSIEVEGNTCQQIELQF